jgi:hypothetical protein
MARLNDPRVIAAFNRTMAESGRDEAAAARLQQGYDRMAQQAAFAQARQELAERDFAFRAERHADKEARDAERLQMEKDRSELQNLRAQALHQKELDAVQREKEALTDLVGFQHEMRGITGANDDDFEKIQGLKAKYARAGLVRDGFATYTGIEEMAKVRWQNKLSQQSVQNPVAVQSFGGKTTYRPQPAAMPETAAKDYRKELGVYEALKDSDIPAEQQQARAAKARIDFLNETYGGQKPQVQTNGAAAATPVPDASLDIEKWIRSNATPSK